MAAVSPARAAAFDILMQVEAGRGNSDDLLHSARVDALSPEDRNLTTALVMGVLRWQIALDARLMPLFARPGQQPAPPVAIALRLGALQLLHMDRIPPHAALNESVELCRASGNPHAAGMVNAVLRKITVANPERTQRNSPILELPSAFAERLGHPRWLVERWAVNYGRAAALAICEYDQREPRSGGLFAAHFAEAIPSLQIDDGSRLVAELAAASTPHAVRVWDCCAAPGGKTLVLAQRLPDAQVLASDISSRRLARMAERIAAQGVVANVRCEVADAAKDAPDGPFDLILCDMPCSGTGTLARNPEIRHRLRPEDLSRQAERQRAILGNVARQLAPGGRLVYSSCSLEPEENEQVVRRFASDTALKQLSVAPLIEQLASCGQLEAAAAASLLRSGVREDALRTLPGIHLCDGFFAGIFARN